MIQQEANIAQHKAESYLKLSTESQVLERAVEQYSEELQSALSKLELRRLISNQCEISEMREVLNWIQARVSAMRQLLQSQVKITQSEMQSIRQRRAQMKQLAQLMAAENSKSTRLLEGLRAELLQKLNEIGNCNAKTALHQQQLQIIEFKRSHYVNFDSTSSVNNQCSELLNMLRMIEHKLKMQLNYELQQRTLFNYKIGLKLSNSKALLLESWSTLRHIERKQRSQLNSSHNCKPDTDTFSDDDTISQQTQQQLICSSAMHELMLFT